MEAQNNSNYQERGVSKLTAHCSIRIVRRNPKGRAEEGRKSVKVRKQNDLCWNDREMRNTWKPKQNWPRRVLERIFCETITLGSSLKCGLLGRKHVVLMGKKSLHFRMSDCSSSSYRANE